MSPGRDYWGSSNSGSREAGLVWNLYDLYLDQRGQGHGGAWEIIY